MVPQHGSNGNESYQAEVDIETLLEHLEELEQTVDSTAERDEVRRAMQLTERLPAPGVLNERIRKYTTRDMAEAFVGAVIFSVPLVVEDGVFSIASHFLTYAPFGIPLYLFGNLVFIVVMTYGLIYWADIQRVHISKPIFGVIPRRLVGVLLVSLLTAAMMMTLWGRVENWTDPGVAIARINVVWTISAFGGALGDILPGESRGKDINEVFEDLSD